MCKMILFACALALCFVDAAFAEASYDETRELGQGYSMVRLDEKWGVIDAAGVELYPPEYDLIYLDEDGMLYACGDGRVECLWLGSGAAQEADPNLSAGAFIEGGTVVCDVDGYGLADANGALLLPRRYDGVELWEDGRGYCRDGALRMRFQLRDGALRFCHVHENGDEEFLPAWAANWSRVIPLNSAPKRYLASADGQNCSWSLLDADGTVLKGECLRAIPDFERVTADADGRICPKGFTDGVVLAEQADGRYGFVTDGGEWLAHNFVGARDFSEGLAAVETKEGWGFIDRAGNCAVKPQYAWAESFDHGHAAVSGEDYRKGLSGSDKSALSKWGLIDRAGAVVLPLKYDSIDNATGDGVVKAVLEGASDYFALTEDGVREVASVGSDLLLEDYMPFTGERVAKLDDASALELRPAEGAPLPRLDGATALFPVYAAFVEAVYPEDTRFEEAGYGPSREDAPLVTCTRTNRAYERLIAGEADVIFCAGPSDAQLAMARDAGVEFDLTPFGREAFVFIVNADNPLEDISTQEIRGVYSGAITGWDALGVEELGEITAYQRPKNSGSQTALEDLMGEVPIMDAPGERVADLMGDIVDIVEEYRNLPSALGYSFRFFCKEMMESEVKLLSVDGVAPTVENIRSGSYPLTTVLYAVTRAGEGNSNVRALLDWVTSGQGRELVEKSGYVGWPQ